MIPIGRWEGVPHLWLICRQQVARREHVGGQLINLDIETLGSKRNGSVAIARGLHIFHQRAVLRKIGLWRGRQGTRVRARATARKWLRGWCVWIGEGGGAIPVLPALWTV